MSAEDWEQRFEAVVRETERNLAKVKGTLQHTPSKYAVGETKKSNNLLDLASPYKLTNSTPLNYKYTSNNNVKYKSPESRLQDSRIQDSRFNSSYGAENDPRSVRFSSPTRDSACHKELWQQENEILTLRKQVSLLQQSNVHYEQETKLLKSQVLSLKNRQNATLPANSRDISREFDKFKDEVMAELRRVKQTSGHGLSEGYVEKEISAIRKDLDTGKLRQAEDFQEVKNDLEKLRSRLVQVELEVKSAISDSKECIRKCQRMNSEASHFSETMRLQNRSTSSQLQSLNDNCAHLSILRSTVSDLEGRLSSIEGSVARGTPFRNESATPGSLRDSSATRGSSYIADLAFNKSRQIPVKENRNRVLDELDISYDDLSLLSDDIDDDDDEAVDKSIDISETSTFKDGKNKSINLSLTESVSVGGETLSMAGELISNMSGILSDEDIS
ncbi:hypothetical protein ACHWQZ_G014359 [Mnemiopsis leidyi]